MKSPGLKIGKRFEAIHDVVERSIPLLDKLERRAGNLIAPQSAADHERQDLA
jgi:hypothetical protein